MGTGRETAERWFRTVKTGDAQAIAALLADDVDFYTPGGPVSGPQEAAGYVAAFAEAVPDATFDVSTWIEEGARVVAEGAYRGTHTGPLRGPQGEVPPTGNTIDVPFVTVFEIEGARITAHRAYWDNATFMAQLGLMPAPS